MRPGELATLYNGSRLFTYLYIYKKPRVGAMMGGVCIATLSVEGSKTQLGMRFFFSSFTLRVGNGFYFERKCIGLIRLYFPVICTPELALAKTLLNVLHVMKINTLGMLPYVLAKMTEELNSRSNKCKI